jgi:hypothetical protein
MIVDPDDKGTKFVLQAVIWFLLACLVAAMALGIFAVTTS